MLTRRTVPVARGAARRLVGSLLRAALALPWLYLWLIPMAFTLGAPPVAAALLMLGILGAFLARNVARPLRADRRLAARLRLRPCARYLPLLTLGVIAKVVLMVAGIVLHEEGASRSLLPPLPDTGAGWTTFLSHPLSAFAVFVALAVVTPLVEEFAFRGKMQGELEHSLGLTAALIVPAAIFSLLHGPVDALHHVPYAIFAGWIVWRTGSIWTAVYMHVLNNAIVVLSSYLPDTAWLTRDMLREFWPSALVAGPIALGALVAIGARIHAIAKLNRPRARAWPLRPSVESVATTAVRG
ncbi:MAG: lysostaphin resistance A-like protein [Gemmatimonadaceae bacterium]